MPKAAHTPASVAKSRATKDPDYVKALERGLKLFEAFDVDHPELTTIEIARKTGLAANSTRRFLITLTELGYLGSYQKRYFLRPKVLEIGYATVASTSFDRLMHTYLDEVVKKTGWASAVSVLDGYESVFLAFAMGNSRVRIWGGVGSRFPVHATSMGRVFLAHLPPDQLELYLSVSQLRRFTDYTKSNVHELKEELERVRREGYAVVQDEFEVGLFGVAVPLRDSKGHVVAALNIGSGGGAEVRKAIPSHIRLLLHMSQQMSAGFACLPTLPFLAIPGSM